MSDTPDWRRKPRTVSVVVDNPSWVLPWAERTVDILRAAGDDAFLVREYSDVREGSAAFLFGCLRICPPDILARNRFNLVVHASDLPKDRGFSPWTWAILEGADRLTVCLIAAQEPVDSGPIYAKECIDLAGHELVDELRTMIGAAHVRLAAGFMAQDRVPHGTAQAGEPTWRRRRTPRDSRLDPSRPLAEQFDLLRVVDNERYPAFFDFRGNRYEIRISKANDKEDGR
ncbi:MAG: hypothetical protein ING29_10535 [Azospirillum sp.]|nr:hypothetical protein [Azospirillum sp.]